MALTTENVPREGELLCENCGYGLSGLPEDGFCPECGRAVAESTSADGRVLPGWEVAGAGFGRRLAGTTWAVIRRPKSFFRRMRTRVEPDRSSGFAFVHHWIAAYLFSVAAAVHAMMLFSPAGGWDWASVAFAMLAGGAAMTPFVFAAIAGVQWAAGKLTVFESRYHGFRMPGVAVRRAMHYHAATLLPVAGVTLGIVAGYRAMLLWRVMPQLPTEVGYLYVLCGWVVVAAGYLFWTYWAGMKAVMFANR